MKKVTLTVFTPTYNRATLLKRGYEALCRQTCKDFCWLIIDDGSTDNTKEVVRHWIEEKKIPISYVKKENGGLHTGYNKAIEIMDTELCVCIDSDDYMPDDAVKKILKMWKEKKTTDIAGIIGLDFYQDNTPIGGYFPVVEKCHAYDLDFKYNHKEDTKVVVRVDLFKQVAPQPTYNNEKNFNPSYMICKIDINYEWLLLNENLCFVDYQADGMANGIYKQYYNSPNSFAAIRINNFQIPKAPMSFYLRQYVHLASSAVLSHNYSWLMKAPKPWLSMLFLPLGFILSLFIRYKVKFVE